MKTSLRIPLAAAAPLPDLASFLAPFRVHFARSEGRHALERYLTGLLTEYPNMYGDLSAGSGLNALNRDKGALFERIDWGGAYNGEDAAGPEPPGQEGQP